MAAEVELPEWAECLWTPSRYKVLWGGRGGGKSRSVATALVLRAAEKPERVLCAREVQKSIKDSVKRLLDDEIDRCGLRDFFTSTESEIRGANGSLFIFTGLRGNAANVKSIEGVTICWVEEAQTISQGSLDTLVPTIRTPHSEIWFSYNPDLATDPIDTMFRQEGAAPPDTIIRGVQFTDNPWFPDVLRAEMEYDRKRDHDKYSHVWLGQYRQNSEARVFKNWRVEDFDTERDAEFRLGADFGYSIDPSCLVRCYLKGRTLFIDHEAYMIGCEIVDLPELFDRVPDARKWFITADSSRPETISYLRKHGYPKVNASIKGPGSVEEGVSFLQSFDIVVHSRCKHVAAELGSYSYKLDSLTGQPMPVLEDKNNHLIDALRYACEGARRALNAKPKVKAVPIPRMTTAFNRR